MKTKIALMFFALGLLVGCAAVPTDNGNVAPAPATASVSAVAAPAPAPAPAHVAPAAPCGCR